MDLSRGDEVFEIPFITWKVYTWIFGGSIPWRTYFFWGGGEEIPNQIHWASVGFNWWMTQKYFFFYMDLSRGDEVFETSFVTW